MTLGIIGRLTGGRFKVPVQYFADVFAHSPFRSRLPGVSGRFGIGPAMEKRVFSVALIGR